MIAAPEHGSGQEQDHAHHCAAHCRRFGGAGKAAQMLRERADAKGPKRGRPDEVMA
jgi:hypothetical protein